MSPTTAIGATAATASTANDSSGNAVTMEKDPSNGNGDGNGVPGAAAAAAAAAAVVETTTKVTETTTVIPEAAPQDAPPKTTDTARVTTTETATAAARDAKKAGGISPVNDKQPTDQPPAPPAPAPPKIAIEPLPDAEVKCVSIICGNSHLQWAFHSPAKEQYSPILFWRTPHMPEELMQEMKGNPGKATETLHQHLPDSVQNYIFGSDEEEDDDGISSTKAHKIKVFLVSTSPTQLAMLQTIWNLSQCVNVVTVMTHDSFFDNTKRRGAVKGIYPTMGSDRVAAIRGAISLYGSPVLVIDGGTACTYTASDNKGNVLGGGISPGIKLRFESMKEGTGALPLINFEEIKQRILSDVPLHVMEGKDTRDAMMASSLGEMGTWLRRVIAEWLYQVGPPPTTTRRRSSASTLASKTNDDRSVVFTGGDAELLLHVTMNPSSITSTDSAKKTSKLWSAVQHADEEILNSCRCTSRSNLVHYGIAASLCEAHAKTVPAEEKKSVVVAASKVTKDMTSWVGERVGKKDDDGDVLEGVVKSVATDEHGDSLFDVEYDNGEMEEGLLLREIEEMADFVAPSAAKTPVTTASPPARKKRGRPRSTETAAKRGRRPLATGAVSTPKSKAAAAATPPKSGRGRGRPRKVPISLPQDPYKCVGLRVAKYFEDDLFYGSVDQAHADTEAESGFYYHVTYDDGDQEDLDQKELLDSRKLYSSVMADDPNPHYIANTDVDGLAQLNNDTD